MTTIIDRIYEAAFAPDQWPGVLWEISSRASSASGALKLAFVDTDKTFDPAKVYR